MKQHHIGIKDWRARSLSFQMANVGSEAMRAIAWRWRDQNVAQSAFWRALELLNLTKAAHRHEGPKLRELCRLYEVLVDYFDGENAYRSSPATMKSYFDFFALRAARENKSKRRGGRQ